MPDEKPVYSGIENISLLTINPNYFNLTGRVLSLILASALLFLLYKLIHVNNQKAVQALYFLFILFASVPAIVCLSFFGIMKVEINKIDGIITFCRIFSKKSITKSDIKAYYNTFSISRRKTFYGLLLELNNDSHIEVNEYNLKSINEIEQYLTELNIVSSGKLRSRFPFKIRF